ncbi:hypothetical protein [Sciscionella sediminilitoris]|uniref:hypothetical protein n=1 Tax=Sciscionella sediminilitoris TaxID=1445613 RepID=UPI0004DFC50E|nr:hypothetical protein [Sciscionella sp. SE31]
MRTYAEIQADARDGAPFANGTEGHAWTAMWCERCLVDAPFRNMNKGSGCPLLLTALAGKTPAEWLDGPRDELGRVPLAQLYICTEFRPPGGGTEPRPRPEPRGMDGLFERPGRGRRTLVPPREAVTADA